MSKRFIVCLLVIGILLCTITVSASTNKEIDDNLKLLLEPATGKYLPVTNIEDQISKITFNQPKNLEFERKFEEHRKKEMVEKQSEGLSVTPPVPGGVGYGFFYTPSFMKNFTNGTSISYDILCPTKAGGNVSDYLYLTATNRSAKGVEAFILYYGQNNLEFRVFDWARPEGSRWQVSLPYSNMNNYLRTKTVHGNTYQFVTVQHRTELVSGNTWKNVVWLGNKSGGYDQIYSYSYTSTVAEQQAGHDWGPIVETFQSSYSNINPMGFDLTYLDGANSSGSWGGWGLLSANQSTTRNDNLGFTTVFKDANYAFAVK